MVWKKYRTLRVAQIILACADVITSFLSLWTASSPTNSQLCASFWNIIVSLWVVFTFVIVFSIWIHYNRKRKVLSRRLNLTYIIIESLNCGLFLGGFITNIIAATAEDCPTYANQCAVIDLFYICTVLDIILFVLWGTTLYPELRKLWGRRRPHDESDYEISGPEPRTISITNAETTQKLPGPRVTDLFSAEVLPTVPTNNETTTSQSEATSDAPDIAILSGAIDNARLGEGAIRSPRAELLPQQLLQQTPVPQTSTPVAPDYITGHQEGFVVRSLIARGSFGEVYSMCDTRLRPNHDFARKVVRALVAGVTITRREIEDEASAINALGTHEHLIEILRHGWLDPAESCYYIDMELCERDLSSFIREPLDSGSFSCAQHPQYLTDQHPPIWWRTTDIMRVNFQLVSGTEYIHRKSHVHRDLKPTNVLYSRKSRCWKIADFGFTSAGSSTSMQSMGARGTTGYRAPELMRDNQFSKMTDIWALGCILYEMCMRTRAFPSDWHTLVRADSNTPMNISIPVAGEPDLGCSHCRHIFEDFSRQRDVMEDINQTLMSMLDNDSSNRPSARSLKLKWGSWES